MHYTTKLRKGSYKRQDFLMKSCINITVVFPKDPSGF